jgi:hypothetical protein
LSRANAIEMRDGNGKVCRYMRKVLEAKMPGYWRDVVALRREAA